MNPWNTPIWTGNGLHRWPPTDSDLPLENIYIREKFMLFQMICYVDVA